MSTEGADAGSSDPRPTDSSPADPRPDGYALGLGALLTTVGVRGFSRERVFEVVGMNRLHAVVHLVFGVAGIAAGARRRGRAYTGVVGVVLLAEGVLGLVPSIRERLVALFNVSAGTTVVQLVLGVLSLMVYGDTAED